jgi:exonuclease SbcC
MNLVRINIENFKQYVDPIEIDIPQQATIGVIGTNGVGKTTLFQAIEWCLYNPSSISGRDIRPRGRTGNPKVSVTLESRDGSKRWIVEREQKRSAATAAVYEVLDDGSHNPIVQGTREVTDFVSTRLIDLSHRAFVATFFTRQKELHFFGDMRDTDRRREVGKLLGLETIRRAQITIGEERTTAVREAQLLHKQYAAEIGERDLEAELVAIEELIAASQAEIDLAQSQETSAAEATARTKQQLESAQLLRERHTGVCNRLERVQSDQTSTRRRHQQRIEDIARLEQARIERESLLPVAAELTSLQAKVTAAEVERHRFVQKTQLEKDIATNISSRSKTVANLATEVHRLDSSRSDPAWTWTDDDGRDVASAMERLNGVSARRPIETAAETLASLTRAKAAVDVATTARSKLTNYINARDSLIAQREEVIRDGEPNTALAMIGETVAELSARLAAWEAERKVIETDLNKRQRVLTNIRNANFEDGCPTCGRKFSEHDEHDITELFSADIATLHERITTGDRQAQEIASDIKSFKEEREALDARSKQLQTIDERIARSVGFIEEQEATAERDRQSAEKAITAAGLGKAPTDEEIEQAEKRVSLARLLREAIGKIQIHASGINQLDADRRRIELELEPLANVSFDQDAFVALTSACNEADRATARIKGFDRELEQLPSAIEERDSLASLLIDIELSIASIKQEIFEIGYDPELLQAAGRAVVAAEQAERIAMQQRQASELKHQRALSSKENVERDHARIRGIVVKADQRQREADELQLMYNLFGEFEQFVVSRLTPALSEITSELVRQVTDGKYDDVTFDDNFGVLVGDGDENPFPLASFSGGERDVIALCARLALSQMIGLQAAEQPGFLVLDEVFGSLDRERRGRLLDLFGNLSVVAERFQQVFIISHVDDVRLAPILDELWRVQESEEGKSTIVNLAPGTDIGEL